MGKEFTLTKTSDDPRLATLLFGELFSGVEYIVVEPVRGVTAPERLDVGDESPGEIC